MKSGKPLTEGGTQLCNCEAKITQRKIHTHHVDRDHGIGGGHQQNIVTPVTYFSTISLTPSCLPNIHDAKKKRRRTCPSDRPFLQSRGEGGELKEQTTSTHLFQVSWATSHSSNRRVSYSSNTRLEFLSRQSFGSHTKIYYEIFYPTRKGSLTWYT